MTVASESTLWWSPQDPHQAALWGSWVELSKKFFTAITAHPIPLDMRALKALKQSPLALDLYSWLTYEAYRAHKSGKGHFVAWKLLAEQIGTDYARTTDFQHKAVATLRKIKALYPALKLGHLRGGVRIEPDSLPAITPRPTATVEHIREAPPLAVPPLTKIADATPKPTNPAADLPRPAWLIAVGLELARQWPGESGEALLAECLHGPDTRKGLLEAFVAAVARNAPDAPSPR